MTTINLEEVSDKLEGKWWHFIRAQDFAFLSRIPDQSALEVEDDDVLIHKQIEEGEKFPTKVFHVIMDGDAFSLDGKEIREGLADKCAAYINEYDKLPFSCSFKKIQKKDGMVIINYSPTGYDKFQLKIKSDLLEKTNGLEGEQIEEYLQNLEEELVNNLEKNAEEKSIPPIADYALLEQVSIESGKGSVYVFDSKVVEINLRKTFYMGNESRFYLIQSEGGQCAPDDKKSTLRRDLEIINFKISEKLFEKSELEAGKSVSFHGKYKVDKKLKVLLQNIRKIN